MLWHPAVNAVADDVVECAPAFVNFFDAGLAQFCIADAAALQHLLAIRYLHARYIYSHCPQLGVAHRYGNEVAPRRAA